MNSKVLIDNGVDLNYALGLLGDIETYNTTVEVFLEECDKKIEMLNSYKENNDIDNYAIQVHSIKSDVKYLGFLNIADIALKEEMAAKEKNMAELYKNFDLLVSEYKKVKKILNLYLNKDSIKILEEDEINTNTYKDSIIIADDSTIIREFVQESFNNEYNIYLAKTGMEVAEIIKNNVTCDKYGFVQSSKIKALLLDLNMPKFNGFQVLDWFNKSNLFEFIPVSVITGSNDKETIMKTYAYPIVDMLTKPFTKEDIVSVVEKTIMSKNISK